MEIDYTKLYNDAPAAYFILDENSKISESNDKGCKLLQINKAELIGKSFSDFILPSNKEKFLLHLQVVFLTFESQTCELIIRNTLGKEIIVQLETVAKENNNDGICWCVVTDISGRMRIFENLKEDKIKLQAIFNNTNDMVFIINSELKILEFNTKALTLLDYNVEEITELEISKILVPIEKNDTEFLERIFLSKRNSGECFVCLKNGSLHKSEFCAIPHYSRRRHILLIKDYNLSKELQKKENWLNDFFKHIFSNIDLYVISIDSENKINYVNENLLQFLAKSESDIKGGNWFDTCIPTEERDSIISQFVEIRNSHSNIFKHESSFQNSNGEQKLFTWQYVILKTDDKYNGTIIFGFDITEKINTEKELKKSEERFFKSIYSVNIPIVITKLSNDEILHVNDSFLHILGLVNSAQIVGKSSIELNVWKNADQRKQIVNTILENNYIADKELILTTKTGKNIEILYSAFLLSINGEDCIYNSFIDISNSKRAEKLLQQSESGIKVLLENSNDLILMISIETHKIIYVNSHACELYGYDKGEFLNIPLQKLFKDNSLLQQVLEKLADEGKTSKFEAFQLRSDKSEMLLEFSATRIKYKGSDAITLMGREISEQKNYKEEINTYIQDLEDKKSIIEKKSNEINLLASKLQKLDDKLIKLNEEKEKFFSIIAHDLRSPFASLLGFAEYLHNEFSNLNHSELQDGFENIYKSVRNGFNLLDNLLQWSRVLTNKLEFNPVEIKLLESINAVLSTYEIIANKKGIQFIVDSEENLTVIADNNMFETILRNLISNAIKFSEPGSKIWISANKMERRINIIVEDQGVGMSKEEQQNIFSISKNKTSLGTLGEEGTGLGLVLCKQFIELNKGELSFESEKDVGTKFIFSLPYE
jgi:two-component system sensor histidine kinase/response regulator